MNETYKGRDGYTYRLTEDGLGVEFRVSADQGWVQVDNEAITAALVLKRPETVTPEARDEVYLVRPYTEDATEGAKELRVYFNELDALREAVAMRQSFEAVLDKALVHLT